MLDEAALELGMGGEGWWKKIRDLIRQYAFLASEII